MYARHNLPEYWVIDIPGNQLWVHRTPNKAKYQSVVQYAMGRITPLALPDVEVEVQQLIGNS